MPYDLLIRHARLHRREGLYDLAVQGGRFVKIAPELTNASATREIDAASNLLSPPLIDAHVHLDARSEERRGGLDCISGWSPFD